MVNADFLKKFSHTTDASWLEVEPGRIGRLRLEGPGGNLDLYTIYLPSGSDQQVVQERARLAQKLSAIIEPRSLRLSIIMGDFNFVVAKEDRITLSNGQWSGGLDQKEAQFYDDTLWTPHGFSELRQTLHT